MLGRKEAIKKIFLLIWLILLVWVLWRHWPDRRLHLVFCSVGQGDAILLTQGNNQILIDGGPVESSSQLLTCLGRHLPFWDRRLELVINTHPEADHFGGLIAVFNRYQVNWFFNNGFDNPHSPNLQELKKALIEHKICSKKLVAGDKFRVGKIYFETLWPARKIQQAEEEIQKSFFDQNRSCPQPSFQEISDNVNNYSLVLQLKFDQFDALLTGDISAEVEQILAWRQRLVPVEVLKIAHHGSKTSTSEELLRATQPQLAIISVGQNNFGHPSPEVIDRLKSHQINYLRTDQQGEIELVITGKGFKLN